MLPGTVRPPVTVRDVRDDDNGVANCNTLSKAEVVKSTAYLTLKKRERKKLTVPDGATLVQ